MSRGDAPLERVFPAHLDALGVPAPGDRVLVALSGGADSVVLLHLLRFHPRVPRLDLCAAHFDHGMRPGSAADADWIRGLARAWGVPLTAGRAGEAPASETEAREARYAFLHETRSELAADWLLTAHHADDQAETVLFRVVRGTGLPGLAGIPERREPGVLRPLLPFWRRQILDYARRARIRFRTDPTNLDLAHARNRIRHRVLPALELELSPAVRRALVTLAHRSRENEDAWEAVLPGVLRGLDVDVGSARISVDLPGLLAYDSGVRTRVIHALARRLGGRLDAGATRTALTFLESGASGRRLELSGGLTVGREFDRLVLSAEGQGGANRPLDVGWDDAGAGELVVGGRRYRVRWSRSGRAPGRWVERFGTSRLPLPLHFREWRRGDRMRMTYGSKKLKKLLAEARVPAGERGRCAVLADDAGRVLWVPGVARSTLAPPDDDVSPLSIGIADDDLP